jgi:hypothetical protein
MLKMLAITCELVNLSCRCHIQAITINIPLSTINIGFFKLSNLRPNKKICVSNRPTNPKILPPTQTFFMPKKIIDQQNPEIPLRFRVCFRLQQ